MRKTKHVDRALGDAMTWHTADDSAIKLPEPILTIERQGETWGDVVVHKTATELEDIMRTGPANAHYARLALEILTLRQDIEDLKHDLERYMTIASTEANRAEDTENQLTAYKFDIERVVREAWESIFGTPTPETASELKSKVDSYEKWFAQNAAALASHGIGGCRFVRPVSPETEAAIDRAAKP